MTRAEVEARLALARAEAARRCGLDAYPAELIAVTERLASLPGHLRGTERAAEKLRLQQRLGRAAPGDDPVSCFSGRMGKGALREYREKARRDAIARNGRAASRSRSDCHGAVCDRVAGGGSSCRACGNGCVPTGGAP